MRRALFVWVFVVFGLGGSLVLGNSPNIFLINLDDAKESDLFFKIPGTDQYAFPNLVSIANSGVRFTNFHANTPLCGPSRAILLRGQYASSSGIKTNGTQELSQGFTGGMAEYRDRGYFENDLSTWMKDAGYQNYFVGKYLHANIVDEVPPGWDEFYHSLGNGYFGTRRIVNGVRSKNDADKYRTNIEANNVRDLITEHQNEFGNSHKPFFMYWAPFCPHSSSDAKGIVEPRFKNLWANLKMPEVKAFNEKDVSDKPTPLQFPTINDFDIDRLNALYRNRLRSLKTFDEQLGQTFVRLQVEGYLENTIFIVMSDNGFCLGENRYIGKIAPRDVCTRVPLFVSGPGIASGETGRHLLGMIDIAPTLVDIAGGTIPELVDGKSFKALIEDPSSSAEMQWRDALLIENWQSKNLGGKRYNLTYKSIRSFDEFFVDWSDESLEYYDLDLDDQQLENRIDLLPNEEFEHFRDQIKILGLASSVAEKPVVTIPSTREYYQREFTVEGIAEDNAAIGSVRVVVKRLDTGEYWDGENWVIDFATDIAELAKPSSRISQWSYSFSRPEQESYQLYFAARCYDFDGNFSDVASKIIKIDDQRPRQLILKPSDGETVSDLPEILGRATDNVGVEKVVLRIVAVEHGEDSGKHWHSEELEWTSNPSFLFLNAELKHPGKKQTQFKFPFSTLGARRIRISARAYDKAGNASPESSVILVNGE